MGAPARVPVQLPDAYVDDRKEVFIIRTQGRLLEVKKVRLYTAPPRGGKRGSIKEFSQESRLRLLKNVAKIDWRLTRKCLFVTLTYPDWCLDASPTERTQHRSQFMRDIEYHLGRQVASLWRCEWVKRKRGAFKGFMAPHFHLILFRVPYIDYRLVNRLWKQAIKYTGYVRTETAPANNGKHAAKYSCKYVAKKADFHSLVSAAYLNKVGRPWGITRGELIPLCKQEVSYLTDKRQVGAAMDVAARLLGRHYVGAYTLFSDISTKLAKEILYAKLETA